MDRDQKILDLIADDLAEVKALDEDSGSLNILDWALVKVCLKRLEQRMPLPLTPVYRSRISEITKRRS